MIVPILLISSKLYTSGMTALMYAVSDGHIKVVECLLTQTASLQERGENGKMPV